MSGGLGPKQVAVLTALKQLLDIDRAAGDEHGLYYPLTAILPRALMQTGQVPDDPSADGCLRVGGQPLTEAARDAHLYRAVGALHRRGFADAMRRPYGRARVYRINQAGLRALDLVERGKSVSRYG
jgi:hypothetical protein